MNLSSQPFQVATDHPDLTLEINEDVPTTRNQIKYKMKITRNENNKIKPNTGKK